MSEILARHRNKETLVSDVLHDMQPLNDPNINNILLLMHTSNKSSIQQKINMLKTYPNSTLKSLMFIYGVRKKDGKININDLEFFLLLQAIHTPYTAHQTYAKFLCYLTDIWVHACHKSNYILQAVTLLLPIIEQIYKIQKSAYNFIMNNISSQNELALLQETKDQSNKIIKSIYLFRNLLERTYSPNEIKKIMIKEREKIVAIFNEAKNNETRNINKDNKKIFYYYDIDVLITPRIYLLKEKNYEKYKNTIKEWEQNDLFYLD